MALVILHEGVERGTDVIVRGQQAALEMPRLLQELEDFLAVLFGHVRIAADQAGDAVARRTRSAHFFDLGRICNHDEIRWLMDGRSEAMARPRTRAAVAGYASTSSGGPSSARARSLARAGTGVHPARRSACRTRKT